MSSFSVVVTAVDGVEDYSSISLSTGRDDTTQVNLNEEISFDDVEEDTELILTVSDDFQDIGSAQLNFQDGSFTVDLSGGGSVTVQLTEDSKEAAGGFDMASEEDLSAEEEDPEETRDAPPSSDESDSSGDDGQEDIFAAPAASSTQYHTDSDSEDGDGGEEEDEPLEPTPLMKWEEQHLKDLQQKAEKERRDRDEIKQQAREWIQRFYDDRTVRVRTQGEQNELHQKNLQENILFCLGQGSVWERTTQLVDMKSARSKKGDLARMRSVLLQVKNHAPEHLARHDGPGAKSVSAGAGSSSGGRKGGDDFF